MHEWDLEIYEAVPVASLPPPHAPFKCEHHDRFKSMLRDPNHVTEDDSVAAGRRFIDSLTAKDRAQCRFHRADWAAIAAASAEIVDGVDGRVPGAYLGAAAGVGLPDSDQVWLESLFRDPIILSDDREEYTNGQHRGCALRFSGADRAAVVVDFEVIVDDFADWTYIGDG
jgi:hypothetical protein